MIRSTSLTRSVLQVPLSKNANFNSSILDTAPYIGSIEVRVACGLLTAGDNDGATQVTLYSSHESNGANAVTTGVSTTNFANTAAAYSAVVDSRAIRRYLKAVVTFTGTNTPARPVFIESIGQTA